MGYMLDDGLSLNDIDTFQRKCNADKTNTESEEKIRRYGLMEASVNTDRKSEFEFKFNVEVPETRIYNQYNSCQCNIYAFLRVVRDVLRKTTDLDADELELSANYIGFYDKLEKINVLYNDLIKSTDLSLERIRCKVDQYIGSFGTFHFCRAIVNKYGLATTGSMNELGRKYDDALVMELLRDKVKCDAVCLLNMDSEDERQSKKCELMYEAYRFLSKVYGEPPKSFKLCDEQLMPLQFKKRYLDGALDKCVTVTTFTKEVLLNSQAFIPSIYVDDEYILALPVELVEEAIVRQLRDGVSVWFSAEESTTLDYENGILDDRLYNFGELLNVKDVSRDEKLLLGVVNYDHAMCITGALVDGGKVRQFKVDNSFGRYGKYDGRLIMPESFFRNCVITAVVNRKYLSARGED